MTTGSLSKAHLTGLASALAGRYRLERDLGASGMATVWLAHDRRHERPVAIKVLRPELSAVLGSERFLDGHRFIVPRPVSVSAHPTVVVGWTDELRERRRVAERTP